MANRIALAMGLIVAFVCVFVVVELTRKERDHLINAKTTAATMVADLFAASISPALDFKDPQAVNEGLRALGRNREVVYAVVWSSDSDTPLGQIGSAGGRTAIAKPKRAPSTTVFDDTIELVREVTAPSGQSVGTALIRVSLERENASLADAEARIIGVSAGISAAVGLLLIAFVRRMVTTPLGRLAGAARRLGRGERLVLDDSGDDEVAHLARTFNYMASAIADREQRLTSASQRLQGVLDHTGQAIIVFGPDGRLTGVWSRLAEVLFRDRIAPGKDVVEVVYPAGSATRIEREAFREWLDVALGADAPAWDELVPFAPKTAIVEQEDGARTLELEFRTAPSEGGAPRILLLATDVTERRNLERTVARKDREHARQIAAMRRLATGGGQAMVRFLETARSRLAHAEKALGAGAHLLRPVAEQVFQVLHTLRTEARSFELSEVEATLAAGERDLAVFRDVGDPDGRALAAVRRCLAESRGALHRAEELFVQESPIGRAVLDQITVNRADVAELAGLTAGRSDRVAAIAARLAARPFGECTLALVDSFPTWARQLDKLAELEVQGRDVRVPEALAAVLGGVLGHLVRNALAHGVEAPAERERAGKTLRAVVRVSCVEDPKGPEIAVEDDGAGFPLAALQRRARELGVVNGGATVRAEELAFEAGLSTAGSVSDMSGYGVGLGAVRAELAEIGYSIVLSSTSGAGSRVVLRPTENT